MTTTTTITSMGTTMPRPGMAPQRSRRTFMTTMITRTIRRMGMIMITTTMITAMSTPLGH
jgi:hypothetical protein